MKSKIKPSEKVRAAMVEEGYTQETLAKTIGIALCTLNIKLNGHRDLTIPEGKRIAEALNRTLDELFL